jgi:hypothetical protein
MHNVNDRTRMIQRVLDVEKKKAARLGQKIVDEEAENFLLRGALRALKDVESFLLPRALETPELRSAAWLDAAEFQLQSAHEQLKNAQAMVDKYGSNLRVIGG